MPVRKLKIEKFYNLECGFQSSPTHVNFSPKKRKFTSPLRHLTLDPNLERQAPLVRDPLPAVQNPAKPEKTS